MGIGPYPHTPCIPIGWVYGVVVVPLLVVVVVVVYHAIWVGTHNDMW